jgi:hypothetical protein
LRGDVELESEFSVEFLAEEEPLSILGTALALEDATRHEIPFRIAAGWRSFWSLKLLLLNRRTSIRQRLKLFASTVGSCVLYCSESWTPRQEDLRMLRTARRAMLRRIVGTARSPDEDYIQWIKRVTTKAESMANAAKVREWTVAHSQAKWTWAGHVERRPVSAWVWRVTSWRDSQWQALMDDSATSARPLRPSRRRWMKFEDSLKRFCSSAGLGKWQTLAMNRDAWKQQSASFAS